MMSYKIHYSTQSIPNYLRTAKWDARFIDLCKHISEWSKDPRTKVGSIIVDGNRDIITGYNGFPSRIQDTDLRLYDYDMKHKLTIHAERNALDNARRSVRCNTLYVTYPPCIRCTVDMIGKKLGRVVTLKSSEEKMKKHHVDIELSKELFLEAGIEFDIMEEYND